MIMKTELKAKMLKFDFQQIDKREHKAKFLNVHTRSIVSFDNQSSLSCFVDLLENNVIFNLASID